MIPLSDNVPRQHRFALATIGLILLNLVIFYFELTGNGDALIARYGLLPNHATLLTLVTYQFLHAGWLHILGNMLYLWVFGRSVEDRLGLIGFLLFFLACGLVGGFVQTIFTHDYVPIIGASVSVAGILGAYLVWYPHAQIKVLLPIIIIWTIVTLPASFVLVLWFLTNVISSYGSTFNTSLGGIAYIGHIAGFLFGALVAYVMKRRLNQVYVR